MGQNHQLHKQIYGYCRLKIIPYHMWSEDMNIQALAILTFTGGTGFLEMDFDPEPFRFIDHTCCIIIMICVCCTKIYNIHLHVDVYSN
jgi:hypothetical protein